MADISYGTPCIFMGCISICISQHIIFFQDFEQCVLSGDRECRYIRGEVREGIGDHRRQSMFFCGHHVDCLPFNTEGALERAKRAVEENYAVVGVLEEMNTTLAVLEHYVPRFFEGASDVYWSKW